MPDDPNADVYFPPQSPMKVGMAGKCPRCGRGQLFDGFLGLKDQCPSCGLDYRIADSGDGPAFFVMSIVGTFAVLFAVIVRFAFGAPPWLTLLLAFGFTGALTALLLRPAKAILFAMQYRNKAAEGRLE